MQGCNPMGALDFSARKVGAKCFLGLRLRLVGLAAVKVSASLQDQVSCFHTSKVFTLGSPLRHRWLSRIIFVAKRTDLSSIVSVVQ